MALPKYDKSKRKSNTFEQLPKDAYVIRIMGAREEKNKTGGGTHLTIAFDIAEGKYADFYQAMFERNTNEDKKWPNDAIYYLTVPSDGAQQYVWDTWNTFFADLEDSNDGFVFNGEPKTLKGKLIGGKFYIEQTEYNGNVYDHTRMKWSCVAGDVRSGKADKLPNDKLIGQGKRTTKRTDDETMDGFVNLPEGEEEELPF